MKTGMIPLDDGGEAAVTVAMKRACIGEFSVSLHDGEGTAVELAVPWTTMKEIYKMMASFAMQHVTPPTTAHTDGGDYGLGT